MNTKIMQYTDAEDEIFHEEMSKECKKIKPNTLW